MAGRHTAPTGEQRQEAEHDAWLFPQRRRKPRGRENPSDGHGPVWRAQENAGELPGNFNLFNNFHQTGQGAYRVRPGGTGQFEVSMRPARSGVRRFKGRGADETSARINHAPDANTRQHAKNVFKLIQTIHHRNIIKEALETGIYPRGMTKQAIRLSDFIKPAAPNDMVKGQLTRNTDDWMRNNMNILYEHYESVIQSLKCLKKNKVALDIAKGWADKRFGVRLKSSTLITVESLLVVGEEEGGEQLECGHLLTEKEKGDKEIVVERLDLNDEEQFPALPTKAPGKLYVAQKNTLTLGQRKTLLEEIQDSKERQERDARTLPQGGGGGEEVYEGGGGTGDREEPAHLNVLIRSNVAVDLEDEIESLPVTLSASFSARPETAADLTRSPLVSKPSAPDSAPPRSRVLPDPTEMSSPDDFCRPAANQHKWLARTKQTETGEKTKGEMTKEIPKQRESAAHSKLLDRSDPLLLNFSCNFDLSNSDDDYLEVVKEGSQATGSHAHPKKSRADSDGVGLMWSTPQTHRARRSRKLQDWKIRAIKPVVFLGDSNLSRIPAFKNPHIQVDSYPGANFYHFYKLFEMAPKFAETGLVVLAVGFNNRDQDPRKTSIKQLRMVVRGAQSVFPNADIFVAKIHLLDSLTAIQKQNLTIINNFIDSHYNHLSCIHPQHVHTAADGIHWTEETAKTIFSTWCRDIQLDANWD